MSTLKPNSVPRSQLVARNEDPDQLEKPILLQSWLPPDGGSTSWYSESLARRGVSCVFQYTGKFADFDREFRRFNRPLKEISIACRLGMEAIDWIAWKRFRNPPPMA